MIKVISSNTTKPRTRTFIQGACGFLATNREGEPVVCAMQEDEESVVIFEEGYCCFRVETFDSDTTLEDWCDGKEYAFVRTLSYSNFRITVEVLS